MSKFKTVNVAIKIVKDRRTPCISFLNFFLNGESYIATRPNLKNHYQAYHESFSIERLHDISISTWTFIPQHRKNSRGIPGIPKIFGNVRDTRDSGNSRENFPGNFFELDHFDIIHDFQHFRSNF